MRLALLLSRHHLHFNQAKHIGLNFDFLDSPLISAINTYWQKPPFHFFACIPYNYCVLYGEIIFKLDFDIAQLQ